MRKWVQVLSDWGNPFDKDPSELYNIDTKQVASPEIVNAPWNIEAVGESQYRLFINESLYSGCLRLSNIIKMNKFPLFGST